MLLTFGGIVSTKNVWSFQMRLWTKRPEFFACFTSRSSEIYKQRSTRLSWRFRPSSLTPRQITASERWADKNVLPGPCCRDLLHETSFVFINHTTDILFEFKAFLWECQTGLFFYFFIMHLLSPVINLKKCTCEILHGLQ